MASKLGLATLGLGIAAWLAGAPAAGAVTITEFPIGGLTPTQSKPAYIASSPTGRLWFTDLGTAYGVRQMNTAGELVGSALGVPAGASAPTGDLAFDPAGALTWFTQETGSSPAPFIVTRHANGVVEPTADYEGVRDGYANIYANGGTYSSWGWLNSQGNVAGFAVCRNIADDVGPCFGDDVVDSRLTDLTADSAGRIWGMQPEADVVRRANATTTAWDLAVPLPAGSRPGRAALGPDGNLWIAAFGNASGPGNTANRIIRLTPAGVPTLFALPPGRGPNDIVAGPDGALWFTEQVSSRIGRISTCGTYTSYPVPTAGAQPYGIVVGADGALWFTEYNAAKIGRLVPDPPPAGECAIAPPPGGGPPGGGGPPADVTKPVLSSFSFSRTVFRAARSGGATAAQRRGSPPVGTRVGFSLSEPGRVTFTVERPASGRRVKGKCVKPKRSNRGKRACTRWIAVRGSFTVAGSAGQNTFTFRGRIGGRALRPGSYRLGGRAIDLSGNASSIARKGFRIVP